MPLSCAVGTRSGQWTKLFKNIQPAVLTGTVVHYVPLIRDVAQWLGGFEVCALCPAQAGSSSSHRLLSAHTPLVQTLLWSPSGIASWFPGWSGQVWVCDPYPWWSEGNAVLGVMVIKHGSRLFAQGVCQGTLLQNSRDGAGVAGDGTLCER